MGAGQSAFAEYAVAPEAALMPVPSAFTGELLAIVQQAKVAPLIGGVYPLEKGAEALLALESRHTIGKPLLKP